LDWVEPRYGLTRWHHAHVEVLLLGLNLLVLLLQQLYLLLDSHLLHYKESQVSVVAAVHTPIAVEEGTESNIPGADTFP
jgi:hypothetical protein